MSMLTELIKEKAAEVLTGSTSIPENLQEKVLGGLSDSIFDSIKIQLPKMADWTN